MKHRVFLQLGQVDCCVSCVFAYFFCVCCVRMETTAN